MFEQPRFPRIAVVPLTAGLLWFVYTAAEGLRVGDVFRLIPGALLFSAGTAQLLWPGDNRIAQFMSLAGVLGMLISGIGLFFWGFVEALVLWVASAASYLAAGAISVLQEPHVEEVPVPEPSLRLDAEVAADEALLATMTATIPIVVGDEPAFVRDELIEAKELFEDRGWHEKPLAYHVAPPPLERPHLRSARVRGIDYEHLSFESEYEPHAEEPGRERWLGYAANRTAHAWVVRHSDPSRPWLFCIHGYQMGWPLIDLSAFNPRWFGDRLGMNLVLPVLPLHGARKMGRRSGDGFLSGRVMDSIHAEAQAMWDMRRILSWVRGQGGTRAGAYGLSLGGYNAALFASVADDLACAIPGIPATDFSRLVWRHGPPLHVARFEHLGLRREAMHEVLGVVSPLVLEPKVPKESRAIFGGIVDRLVPPDQVRDLWRHWDRPKIVWYPGAHMTFGLHPRVRHLIEDTLRDSGMTSA
ncbi:MAG TPA: alpha/beta hydrolase [Myxococcota bacterium]|jgi:hypothetical protein|nr:alpha/beta hydrolase [Myxococcota bacterium]